jgi:hypothetical protein
MYVLKMGQDKLLIPTKMQTIYQGDQLADTLVFLLPATLGDIDLSGATVMLTYIRADGSANVELLKQAANNYYTYLQFTLPIATKLTKVVGEVVLWLNIFSNDSQQQVTQSSTYNMTIATKQDTSSYTFDEQMSALLTLQQQLKELDKNKADGLVYSNSGLQLTSNGEILSEAVYPNKVVSLDDDDETDEAAQNAALRAIAERLDTLDKTKADNLVSGENGLQLTANGELIGDAVNEHAVVDIGASDGSGATDSEDESETTNGCNCIETTNVVMI